MDGANIARDLLNKHGITGARADTVWDAITLHDNGGIAKWKQAEVALVNAGVGADFGAYLDLMQRDDVVAVLRKAPRTGFATGNNFVTDVAYRKVPAFHLSNFCDDVQDDPFAGYAVP